VIHKEDWNSFNFLARYW
jgi:hypothetical protein